MLKTMPVGKKELDEARENDCFVYWYEAPDSSDKFAKPFVARVLLHTHPVLAGFERLDGDSYYGSLLKYENDIMGTFRAVIGKKMGKKPAKKIVDGILKNRDKIITASNGRSRGGVEMLETCNDFPARDLEKNSFYIKDSEFGKYGVHFFKNILSYYTVIDINRPSRKMALHDAEGLAGKYF